MKRIGIVNRIDVCNGINIMQFHDTIRTKLYPYDINVIGIIPKSADFYFEDIQVNTDLSKLEDTLSLCDGIILPGGSDPLDYDFFITKYCHEHNLPLLGICMGMQTMGIVLGGEISTLLKNDHAIYTTPELPVHQVSIDPNSMFYQIIKKEKIGVNSRHHDYLSKLDAKYIVGYSEDGVPEIIEDRTKKFFIGVQWHPEDMLDQNTTLLFAAFVKQL